MPTQVRTRRPVLPKRPLVRERRPPATKRAATGQAGWIWPTPSRRITGGPETGHLAFDIGSSQQGRIGEPVWAPTRSTVTAIRNEPAGYGLNVRLRAASGEEIILGHLASFINTLRPGTVLEPGELVGQLGSSGASTGPHLHFEIRAPGPDTFATGWRSTRTALDPRTYYPSGYVGRPAFGEMPPISDFQFLPVTGAPVGSPSTPLQQAPGVGRTVSYSVPTRGGPLVPSQGVSAVGRVGTIPDQPAGEGEVRIASTPVGDITIPKPPLRKWLAFSFGAVLVVMGAGTLISRGVVGTQKKVANLALDLAPGTGTVRTLSQAAKSFGLK